MGRKTYTIESVVNIQMICVPRSNICPNDTVYLNLELFGETQRSKLMHPLFPIKTNDKFYFNKTFWSPQNEKELHKLMRDSPVSIELRHLHKGSKDSNLLAFADSDSYKLLIEDHQSRVKDIITVERQISLTQTNHNCGQLPCVKLEITSTISCSETPVIDKLLYEDTDLCPYCDKFHLKKSQVPVGGCHARTHCDMFSCACEMHRGEDGKVFHCAVCHQDRQWSLCTRCLKKSDTKDVCNTVSKIEDDIVTDGPGKMRPPFVVRKLDSSIVARKPDAYDSVYNTVMREQSQLRSSRRSKLHRVRSCSPKTEKRDKRSPSNKRTQKNSEKCYACHLPPDEVRISCDSCNLTYCGEPSLRCGDLVRPEPPMLRTYRETTDQKPLYPLSEIKCRRCIRQKVHNSRPGCDDSLMISTRPIYKLDGFHDMAKYFCRYDTREY